MRSGEGGGSMSQQPPGVAGNEPLRWRETSMDPRALPARAADLADAARDVPALAPVTLVGIYSNVVARASGTASRARGVPFVLRAAALAALILVSVTTAKGAVRLWQRYVAAPSVAPAHVPPARPKTALAVGTRRRIETAPIIERIDQQADQAPPQPGPPAAARASGPAAAVRPRRMVTVEPAPPEAPTPAAPAPAINAANEAQLLADALGRLRQAHDPRGALAVLDRYEKTYPRGVLAAEARSARLEATLKVGDRTGALALLDERTTFVGRLGSEQLLTRAELRASVGRYADALADFNRVLAPAGGLGAPQPEALERALYGRAVTLGHLGRDDRARADLDAYLRSYPAGKFAAEVERLLGKQP